ncbi:MAG: DNA mismatch repair protein MutS [Candidatus Binataceae bacterium]|nr:DNA mismatch repair protein MutS [Candidatus Binataceae bacterium]
MKAHLLFEDQDFLLERSLPWNEGALVKDLSLDTLFTAMARGDAFVFEVSKRVVLLGSDNGLETIRYRQRILQDCLNQPEVVRELYSVSVEAMVEQKRHYLGVFARSPDSVLRYSIELMEGFLGMLKALRRSADLHADKFVSEGWTAFYAMLRRELSDDFFARVDYHLDRLKFRDGVLLSAHLGQGNKGDRYVLREPPDRKGTFLTRLFTRQPPAYSFTLHPRDESGFSALADLRNRGIGLVADTIAQSTGHIRSFFDMLRTELAFYVGCVNLHQVLQRRGVSMALPSPVAAQERRLSFQGLRDACLALSTDEYVVGNDGDADGQDLVIVTGANQGGKSTFLRSVGLAQLMMQCGMFVSAGSLCSSVRAGLFTHYKREEDTAMNSGKLDEELSRMSDIIDHITPNSMILFNESFAATNEREGSEIAKQIVSALLDKRVKIVFVTHLHELARGFHENNSGDVLFLRAERQADGVRTYKLLEGEPLKTSFGEDLYNSIFGG